MALFHYYDTATVRTQHQLLTCKASKWHSLLFQKTTIFELSAKLNEMQYLELFRVKNFGKFTNYNFEKLFPRSLASTIPVLGLKKVCRRKGGP